MGVLLPPSVPAVLVNLALAFQGKIAVNLNYTAGQEQLNASLAECGITHVVTSRIALRKMGLEPRAELIHVEDIPKQATNFDKGWAAMLARVVPSALLGLFLPGLRHESRDATATVIFTSGTTGEPKGVMLTHGNILSNAHQIDQLVRLQDDMILGVLPFFHSFGYTINLWTVLCLGQRGAYHFNPLDARIVGHLCQENKVTLVITSPTFAGVISASVSRSSSPRSDCSSWALRSSSPSWPRRSRRSSDSIRSKAMAAPRTGPVVSASIPEERRLRNGRTVHGYRLGTVGIPVAGTAIKTIDPDTGADLPRGQEGLVLVKGPQIMKGYLNRPELTAKVLRDGWYTTGDLGCQDADGFLTITGRLSRFSKIGGEMVPHERIESAILQVAEHEHPHVAVTAVPDPKRGERLVVLYTDLGTTPGEIHRRLLAGPLPRLWIPSVEDFVAVESIPILGTGKVDLRQVRRVADEMIGSGKSGMAPSRGEA